MSLSVVHRFIPRSVWGVVATGSIFVPWVNPVQWGHDREECAIKSPGDSEPEYSWTPHLLSNALWMHDHPLQVLYQLAVAAGTCQSQDSNAGIMLAASGLSYSAWKMSRVNESWLQSYLFYLNNFAIFLYLCYLFSVFLEINLLILRHKNFKKETLYQHVSRKPVFFVISGR